MMSNLNCNIYDLPPTQHYQEYGVYDETNDTSAEPLVYVPTIDRIQYTGVTSFEFNGTTYYNYILYEAPVLSYQDYGVYDETSDTSAEPLVYVPTIDSIQYTGVTSFEFNGTTYYNYNLYEAPVLSYPVYDYTPEVYSDDYQYGDYAAFVDDADDTMLSTHYSQYSYDSTSSHLSTDSNLSITYDISHSNFISSSIQCPNSFNNISDEDNNCYIPENNVSFTEPSSSSCDSFLTVNEDTETDYQNDPLPNNKVENISPIKNEDTDLQNGDDSYRNISVINIKHDADVSNESTVFEQSVDINENELNEHCDNYSFISEESKVLDWSIEVENDDSEKDDDDEDNDDDDDTNKVNLLTLSDIDPYYTTEVVKYLKEQLYIYALSGHMSLKESLPVVDILPIIEENSESVGNADIFEPTVEVLENREGNIRSVIEERDNVLYNLSFDISEPTVENNGIEFENEKLEQVKTKITNVTEDDTKSFPIFNMSQKSVYNKNLHTAQRHEVLNTDDKLLVQESKEVLTQLSSVEESKILVGNVPKLAETDIVFNASSKMNQSEEENLSKPQIMDTKQFVSTDELLCSNADSLLKSVKNVEKRNKVSSNPVHRNHAHNTTVHVPSEAGSHAKCYSGANVEKTRKSEEKISVKGEKKKFNTFRKWLSNLCCCVRKNT